MKLVNAILVCCAMVVAVGAMACLAGNPESSKKKILLYSQSFGFRHSCVTRPLTGELSHVEKVVKEIGTRAGYEIFVSQDFRDLDNEGSFRRFDAIIFYTTGNPLIHRDGLHKWLRDGGALIGVHSATDSFQSDHGYAPGWPDYVRFMGGAFAGHGGNNEPVVMRIEDSDHPATRVLEGEWTIADEIYQFRDGSFSRDNVHMLLSVDTARMTEQALAHHNFKKGEDYPIAWTNTEGDGRVFYTSLGHREDVWTNPKFQKHLLGGIAWALREKE